VVGGCIGRAPLIDEGKAVEDTDRGVPGHVALHPRQRERAGFDGRARIGQADPMAAAEPGHRDRRPLLLQCLVVGYSLVEREEIVPRALQDQGRALTSARYWAGPRLSKNAVALGSITPVVF